jgi:hypothetical protein
VIDLLKPAGAAERPGRSDPLGRLYVRSFLVQRVLVGVLAILLPPLLVIVDGLWFHGDFYVRNSISAYYYSGASGLFVGGLCATGIFLGTYKVVERNLDNTLSLAAGFAATFVALFPTGPPADWMGQTQLQEHLGENVVQGIHYVSAFVFLASLAGISYQFGQREKERAQRDERRSPQFWRAFHHACAAVIVLGVVVVVIALVLDRRLFWGEVIAVWAFGASWLMKGLELDYLRGE